MRFRSDENITLSYRLFKAIKVNESARYRFFITPIVFTWVM